MDSLSRLTKVQELRKKIEELFHVDPQLQRLFYRGKQVSWPPELSIRPPSFVPSTLPLKATKQQCPPTQSVPEGDFRDALNAGEEGEQRQASSPGG